ncbi:hypothetical protein DL769_007277 [Monosporascus sp. CRB-8-3]|nr:hypothetical protein DL769_007277 [Monosporascus sp. CRB-8-3]
MASTTRLSPLTHSLFLVLRVLSLTVSAEDCSKTKLCKIGCCSKDGFCGTTSAHCGAGWQSTCDYKAPPTECSATKLCATGCCSKDGFCGTTEAHCGKGFCSKENCVAGCDAKTSCDPGGYGPEFAEHSKCPLNVCRSKHGYCGLTEEFCGKKKVTRPSCSAKDQPLRRVVGYYEGWATGRSCDQFKPSDIPDDVYTHINFAFASIDPNTFKVVPAAKGDPDLYRQLTQRKQIDPNLRVFIAIGSWAFNDPGPTVTTFSDIARSEASQRMFISSLVSPMNTYDFDGLDIDWEYPVAPDRQGRGEDFENLPKFLRNIRSALKQNGARNGLSIAIPASYWYLQHFDIEKIAAHVDYFNIMTYDFHGSWDTPESWLGNHLNSHTNLTEIEDALDLLWRNQIDPDQVNLGLAFYSRTFTASDPGCMSPGCLFDSGSPKGACSNAVGVLSNAEVVRKSSEKSSHVELNKEAAVKILTNGREWMTYDDADTWKLKLDFARGQCLGGAMVWAISQDTSDGKFSKQLQSVMGYKSRAVTTITTNVALPGGVFKEIYVSESSSDVTKDQCRWSNCGKGCPSGWQAVKRRDPYKHSIRELMFDDTDCDGNGSRTGKCSPGCPDNDQYEIASTKAGCNNGKAQVVCCSGKTPAMDIYRQCEWYGKEHDCAMDIGTKMCGWSDKFNMPLTSSWDGSGAQVCRESDGHRGTRPYCCDVSDTSKAHWKNCAWYDNFALGLTPFADREQCNGNCPAGKIKVALQKNEYSCKHGTLAYCCDAEPEGVEVATVVKCDAPEPSAAAVRYALQDIIEHYPTSKLTKDTREAWDDAILPKWMHLSAATLSGLWSPYKGIVGSTENVADAILCNMDEWDEEIEEKEKSGTSILQCPLKALAAVDPSLLENPDDTLVDDESTTIGTLVDQVGTILSLFPWFGTDRRSGGVREFPVKCPNKDTFKVFSEKYINGKQGDALANANNDKRRYYLDNQGGNCFASDIADDGEKDDDDRVSEHILELQAFRDLIEYTMHGMLTRKVGSKYGVDLPLELNTAINMASCPMWKDAFRNCFQAWKKAGHTETPMKYLYSRLGSIEDSSDMVNCETKLNSMKARVGLGLKDPVSVSKWDKNCARMTQKSAENAITEFELLWGVWQYHNEKNVKTKLLTVHMAVADFLQEFEKLYREQFAGAPDMDLEASHWREYMVKHFGRMLAASRGWAEGHLKQLTKDWTEHLNGLIQRAANGANVANDIGIAQQAILAFQQRTLSIPGTFTFDTDLFLFY